MIAPVHHVPLTIPEARGAILRHERRAVRGEHLTVAVPQCERLSSTVVGCAVTFTGPIAGLTVTSTDPQGHTTEESEAAATWEYQVLARRGRHGRIIIEPIGD